MGGDALKAKAAGLVGGAAGCGGVVAVGGVPMQHHIDIVEQPRPNHIDLAGAAFLRWRAIDPHGAGIAGCRQPAGHGHPRRSRGCAEQVVAAGVAGHPLRHRLPNRLGGLGEPGQRIGIRRECRSPACPRRRWPQRRWGCRQRRSRRRIRNQIGRIVGAGNSGFRDSPIPQMPRCRRRSRRPRRVPFQPRPEPAGRLRRQPRRRTAAPPGRRWRRSYSWVAHRAAMLEIATPRRPWRIVWRSWVRVQ